MYKASKRKKPCKSFQSSKLFLKWGHWLVINTQLWLSSREFPTELFFFFFLNRHAFRISCSVIGNSEEKTNKLMARRRRRRRCVWHKVYFKYMHKKKQLQTLRSAIFTAPWIRHTGRLSGSGGTNRLGGEGCPRLRPRNRRLGYIFSVWI